ncbi:Tyrosinase central domain-containing protein [Mycena venus]|uniref:Tyrosinase central domain-containing protein n=1 Tax=Mycena venus TaxID=2733690 RepID=A0A8H7DEF9_9AGAR|nr:Tyrosinase central domain-containing protein [Mycena venus]
MVNMYEKKKDNGDAERAAAVAESRIPTWLIFVSSILLVFLSSLLAFLAVIAFSAVHPIVIRPPLTTPNTTSPTSTGASLCAHPALRQEWRVLSNAQKLDYITAVQCLQRLPSISDNLRGAKTRFDDFQAIHVVLSEEVHLVGQFLPWHRRLLNMFEVALREECGFQGALPYWDWSRDVDSGIPLVKSPVFDAVYGFGGNGADIPNYAGQFGNLSTMASAGWVAPGTGGGCVVDGPFAAYNLSVGPGTNTTNHCLQRAFNDNIRGFLSSAKIAEVARQTTFEAFRIELEGAPVTATMRLHDGGHNAVGGEMADRYSSPGDPIFYLHHAFLDKLWWQWVGMNFSSRIADMSGRSTVDPPFVNVTLDFGLDMMAIAPKVTIREVMDIRNDLLCYIYE